jgi:hypothetical protein
MVIVQWCVFASLPFVQGFSVLSLSGVFVWGDSDGTVCVVGAAMAVCRTRLDETGGPT